LWEAVEEDYEVLPLPTNPTMAQIKNQKERKARKSKARASLFVVVSKEIFTTIMTIKSAYEIWSFLKNEYEGDERIKGMQALNLVREFEIQKMKESEIIKEYANKLLSIANKVRLLGSEFSDSRIVEKTLVTVPKRFEATITSLENTKDLSKLTLAELVNALQAQEQRRRMRADDSVEGALQAKLQINQGEKNKWKKYKKKNFNTQEAAANTSNKSGDNNKGFPPYKHCGRMGHPPVKCWRRPDVKCEKCNKLGHHVRICKSNLQQKNEAKVADQQEEEQLFVVTCFTSNSSTECWLADSGCTNHMTHYQELFRELDKSQVSKVRIKNGDLITVEGKGTVVIESCTGTKLIYDVLYVPEIDQNLLSVGQLVEKGFKVIFENKHCLIKDVNDKEIFSIKMRGKSFSFDSLKEEQAAYPAIVNSN
ncbi:Retrovirus-related Pol polyprotein from transposon TNT 1-94, partial [Glycine soja]